MRLTTISFTVKGFTTARFIASSLRAMWFIATWLIAIRSISRRFASKGSACPLSVSIGFVRCAILILRVQRADFPFLRFDVRSVIFFIVIAFFVFFFFDLIGFSGIPFFLILFPSFTSRFLLGFLFFFELSLLKESVVSSTLSLATFSAVFFFITENPN